MRVVLLVRLSHTVSYTVNWYSYSSPPLCETHKIIALVTPLAGVIQTDTAHRATRRRAPRSRILHSRDHDASVHSHICTAVVDVSSVVGYDVLQNQNSLFLISLVHRANGSIGSPSSRPDPRP